MTLSNVEDHFSYLKYVYIQRLVKWYLRWSYCVPVFHVMLSERVLFAKATLLVS